MHGFIKGFGGNQKDEKFTIVGLLKHANIANAIFGTQNQSSPEEDKEELLNQKPIFLEICRKTVNGWENVKIEDIEVTKVTGKSTKQRFTRVTCF